MTGTTGGGEPSGGRAPDHTAQAAQSAQSAQAEHARQARQARRWMAAALGLTFVVGVSAGVVTDRLLLTTPEAHVEARAEDESRRRSDQGSERDGSGDGRRESLLTRLTRELDLSETQHRELEVVLGDNRQRAREFYKESRRQYGVLREDFRDKIRAVLTDDQRAAFNEMLARDDARRRRRQRSDERD